MCTMSRSFIFLHFRMIRSEEYQRSIAKKVTNRNNMLIFILHLALSLTSSKTRCEIIPTFPSLTNARRQTSVIGLMTFFFRSGYYGVFAEFALECYWAVLIFWASFCNSSYLIHSFHNINYKIIITAMLCM